MKKRVLCFLLTLAMLLTFFPTVAVAAAQEDALPKDNGTGVNEGASAEGTALSVYDRLYVGADGTKTANGGSLLALYTVYGDDASVDLTAKKWQNKMDATGATDAIFRGSYWQRMNGGVGYAMDLAQFNADGASVGITLPEAFAALESFTVESVSAIKGIRDADGSVAQSNAQTWKNGTSTFRLDLMSCSYFAGYRLRNGSVAVGESFCARWFLTNKTYDKLDYRVDGVTSSNLVWENTARANGSEEGHVILGAYFTKKTDGGNVTYGVDYSCGLSRTDGGSGTAVELNATKYAAFKAVEYVDAAPRFSLYNGLPADVYAIRVYDAPLTAAELTHNRFIDVLAMSGADMTRYLSLSATERSFLEAQMSGLAYGADAETVNQTVNAMLDNLVGMAKDVANDTYYVTDGLSLFLSAYQSYSTVHTEIGGKLYWTNGVGTGEMAAFRGTGWTRNAEGGFSITKSYDEYLKDRTFGLYLPTTLLPEESYTVEFVCNPVGISDVDENGEAIRYVDDHTNNGTYHEYGIGIGPLRGFQFACYRPAGRDGRLERRWVYNAGGGLAQLNWTYKLQDKSWSNLAYDEIVTYAVVGDFSDSGVRYSFYHNTDERVGSLVVDTGECKTNAEAGNMFQLMVGVAGTMYAVRVYDRVLTDDERARNHMADLICFYGLDVTAYDKLIDILCGFEGGFDGFLKIGFNLTKEEVETAFYNALTACLVSYGGIGIKKGDEDALRFYFDISLDGLSGLSRNGYSIEVGALVNVGKNTAPTLEGYNFDYKLPAYDDLGGRTVGYFVDEDTFSVTVFFKDMDKALLLTELHVLGYLKMVDESGEETVAYFSAEGGDVQADSLFAAYVGMKGFEQVKSNAALYAKVSERVMSCYEKTALYVAAGAAAGGDGSKNAPYNSFVIGFEHAKSILRKAGVPLDVTLILGDGEYSTGGEVTLTGDDMPYAFSNFTMMSENGKSVLTTAERMDSSRFTEAEDNLWVYQLEKDEKGEYPTFRYIYVGGKKSELAAGSPTRGEDENIYRTKFGRKVEGTYEAAKKAYNQGILQIAENPYTRADLAAEYEYYKQFFMNATKEELEADPVYRVHPMDVSKVYLDTEMLGDLRDEVAAGLATAEARAAALVTAAKAEADAAKAAYEAASGTVKDGIKKTYEEALAALTAAEERAALMTGEYTGYRFALEELGLEMHITAQWCFNIIHIAGIDYEDTLTASDGSVHVAVYLVPEEYEFFAINESYDTKDRYVYIKNDLSYVDEENEMYYDKETGKIYYYAESDPRKATLDIPTSDYLLTLERVHDVSIIDLSFTGTDDVFLSENGVTGQLANCDHRPGLWSDYPDRSAIRITYCNDLSIEGCSFYELAVDAIHANRRNEDLLIYGCTFENLGGTAMRLGPATRSGVYGKWGETTGNLRVRVEENYVNNVATEYHGAPAMSMTFNKDCTVTHNTILNCSYSAMMIGFGFADFYTRSWWRGEDVVNDNTEISYNYVTNFMTEMADGAAIYMTMYNSNREDGSYFNFVHHNYVKMSSVSGDGRGGMLVGIYFDGGTSNWKCYNNVVAEQSYGAVKGEADEEADSHYISRLRKRYTASIFIYFQHIENQESHHILCENNYILNVRADDPANQQKEVYRTYVATDRDIDEIDTHYERDMQRISLGAEDIIYGAGCYRHMGDPAELYDNNY